MGIEILRERLKSVGMSKVALAERAGLTVQTLSRTLSGKSQRQENLKKIATALGMEMTVTFTPLMTPFEFREEHAAKKAKRLVKMTQATSALESQAVGSETLDDAIRQTKAELVAGSPRRLWG